MIRLILFRHAKAVRKASAGDKDRGLENRGRAAAERIGEWMRAQGLRPELALVSDARRTRETFAHAAARLGARPPLRLEPRIYEAACDDLLRLVRPTDPRIGSLLLVGHNPGLADLASALAGGGDRGAYARMRLKFPTGALAELSFAGSWAELGPGRAELVRFVTPSSLDADMPED